jgi:hypothetical protein
MKNIAMIGLLVVVGCGVDAPHDVQETSGTRLKIEWWELASGDLQARGVYDSALAAECTFEQHADTTWTCGDVAAAYHRESASSRIVPTWMTTDDGLVWPLGFYDTARGLDCVPRPTASGDLRCAPELRDVTADDPLLSITSEPASGDRLARRYLTSDDGLYQHLPSFFDQDLDTSCSVLQPGYCLPSATPALPLDAYVAAVPVTDP